MNSKIKKFFLVLIVVCVFVIGFFAIKIVTSLPSPQQIAQSLKGFGKKPSQANSAPVEKNQDTVKSEVEPLSPPPESLNSTALTNEKKSPETIAKENEQIEKLLNEDPNELNVCENLGNPSFTDQVKEKGENLKIDDLFSDERRGDPAIEAFRYPIKALFQDEMVAPLMKEIIDLQKLGLTEDEKSGFLDKVGFYSRVGLATAHLYSRKEELEYLGNRAAHLVVINQIIKKKPELLSDPNLRDFCNNLQNSIKERQQIDIKQERSELEKLIKYAGLTNKDLNFDPKDFIKFSVKSEKGNVTFSLSSNDQEEGQKN